MRSGGLFLVAVELDFTYLLPINHGAMYDKIKNRLYKAPQRPGAQDGMLRLLVEPYSIIDDTACVCVHEVCRRAWLCSCLHVDALGGMLQVA